MQNKPSKNFQLRGSQKGGGSAIWEKFPKNTVFFGSPTKYGDAYYEKCLWKCKNFGQNHQFPPCIERQCCAMQQWRGWGL